MASFEIGSYTHQVNLDNLMGIDRLTCVGLMPADVQSLQKQFPKLRIGSALHAHQVEDVDKWKKITPEITLLVSQGMQLQKTCKAIQKQGIEVRIALPAVVDQLKGLELESFEGIVDLMAFDYATPTQGGKTVFHSPLATIEETLTFLHAHGIKVNRINLGLSTRGVMFKHVDPGMTLGYGQESQGEQLKEFWIDPLAYLETNTEAKTYYTSFLGCFQSFIYNSQTKDWISYDDAKTRLSKIEWARHRGLHGIFTF